MSLVLLNELPNCERIKIQGASDGDTLFRGGLNKQSILILGGFKATPFVRLIFFIF